MNGRERRGDGRWSSAGFSLVEALTSLGLLTVGALSAVTIQRASIVGNRQAHCSEEAVSLAEQLLEKALALPYADPALAATPSGHFVTPDLRVSPESPLDADGAHAGDGEGSHGYDRVWEIVDDAPAPNIKTITVKVTWSDRGHSRELLIPTLKAR